MIKTIFLNKKNKEKIEKLYRQRYSEDNLIGNIEKKVREIISKVKKRAIGPFLNLLKSMME